MNEDRIKRGLANSKFLTAVAISALFLSSGNAMAAQTNTDSSLEVTEQLQVQTVSGLVVDASGDPVIGASVVEIGTTNGIITDMDGKFTLNVKPGATLRISFVGYQTQETKASKTMKVVLKEDSEMLSEVVVVGYGVQKKANLTGAVSTVDLSKTMEGRPQQDVAKARCRTRAFHSEQHRRYQQCCFYAYSRIGNTEQQRGQQSANYSRWSTNG